MDKPTFHKEMESTIELMHSHLDKIEEALEEGEYRKLAELWSEHRNASHHAMSGSIEATRVQANEN